MYTNVGFNDSGLRQALEEWEAEHDVPLVVMNLGGGRAVRRDGSVRRRTGQHHYQDRASLHESQQGQNHWPGMNLSPEDLVERGITLYNYGSLSPARNEEGGSTVWPEDLLMEGAERPWYWEGAYLIPRTDRERVTYSELVEVGEVGTGTNEDGHTIRPWRAEVDAEERVVAFYSHIGYLYTGTHDVEQILSESLASLAEDPEEGLSDEERAERRRLRFVELLSGREDARIRAVESRLGTREAELIEAERRAIRTRFELRQDRREYDALIHLKDNPDKDAESEWQALSRNAKVAEIGIRGRRLTIKTVPLTLTNPLDGEQAPLGEFEIRYPVTGDPSEIRIANLTNTQDSRHHPHIPADGPCYGDVLPAISKSMATGDIAGTLDLLIQFLETFNPADSWGRYAAPWFEAERRRREEAGEPEPVRSESETLNPVEAARALGIGGR